MTVEGIGYLRREGRSFKRPFATQCAYSTASSGDDASPIGAGGNARSGVNANGRKKYGVEVRYGFDCPAGLA
jgi:hypothetical protein